MADTLPTDVTPTATDALHATLDEPFEDALARVQVEHEIAGFETVTVTRLDHLIEAVLDEEFERHALLIICHAEVAQRTLEIDSALAGLLPCTTAVYERPDDDLVHVHHFSATKAMRDLGCAPDDEAVADLVALTGDRMTEVWENIERAAATGAD